MGRVAEIIEWVRETLDDGVRIAMVKIDPGGGRNLRAQHYADTGDDSQPLPQDFVATGESVGSAAEVVLGYHDVSAPGKSGPGEKYIYARNTAGAEQVWVWLKSDGSAVIENVSGGRYELEAGGDVVINGVRITANGEIQAPGEITAKHGGAQSVGVTTHLHPTAMGPSGAPTPGT